MGPSFDVIVVGSGASGVHAAYPLVQAGRQVAMIDVGHEDDRYRSLIPSASFMDIRRNDPHQHRYFLGDDLEGIPLGGVGAGPQITPPRQFVLRDGEALAPKLAPDFFPLESFAMGGLAGAWGAVSFPFLDSELHRCGLPAAEVQKHYQIVAQRIGVSGKAHDDLESVRGRLAAMQPALEVDHNARKMLGRYQARREAFQRAGVYLGQTLLAALSQPIGARQPNAYNDMDFWTNTGDSVYRPEVTLRELSQRPNFHYLRPFLVESFSENVSGQVQVSGRRIHGTATEIWTGRALIMAAGSLGTTRIVLRSLKKYDQRVPFACNPHTYIPCVHYRALGQLHQERCHSLAQLTMVYDPTRDQNNLVQAQSYSYRSLMLFRLLKQAPLPYREGLRIMRALAPSFVIWVVQHDDVPDSAKYCVLRRGSDPASDRLEIGYRLSTESARRQDECEKTIMRHIRKIGCCPIKRVHPGHGSSVHYGGQFPMTRDDKPLTTDPAGRLRGTKAVYIVDGSSLAYLPAKGPTLTLMANANRVGGNVLTDGMDSMRSSAS